jgi:hypothetical protein
MSAPSRMSSGHTKAALLVGVVSFVSFIYFYEGGGWNQNSRFDLLRAIVERHTLQIDAYHENTGDKAHVRSHYYSDKAPGQVFTAVPFALLARPVLRTAGIEPESPRGEVALSYLANAGGVALPTALAAVCLFFLGLRMGSDASGAVFGALAMALATPMWAYASLFWAHALVGAWLVFAFAAALQLGDSLTAKADFIWALAVGLAAGWATVTEYPAAPASAAMAVLALSQAWGRGPGARWRTVAGVGTGALLCLIALMAYLYAAFGSFRPSYSYYDPNSFTFMQQRGYMGLTYPHVDVLLKLLFGCRRGLFFASPVAVGGVVGLYLLSKDRSTRAPAIAAIVVIAYYLLFNASFYWWQAGLSFGPRYIGAAMPLLFLGLPVAWKRARPAWRGVLLALAACSLMVSLMVVSTTSQLSVENKCPLVRQTWPAFWGGRMALNRDSMLTVAEAGSSNAYGAFNLGQLPGLRGLTSLIPLLAIWGSAVWLWIRIRRGQPSNRSPQPS